MPQLFQRETDDWAYVPITQQGSPYAGAWSYQIVPWHTRPTGTWTSAVTNGTGQKGIDIAGLTPGYWWVFVRIDGQTPYAPILDPLVLAIG